ncbi:MAG: gamma-glutamyltransferase family protein [Gemmatimonadetes bacterium]|nr:gamma-glutamyltransferase family protein [Gemmatimonadota bacterium]
MTPTADALRPRPTTLAQRSTVYAPHGAIATSQPLATSAGLAVLMRGGNAVDAAVTAAAVLAAAEPHMTGIGGDAFAILWSARERRLVGLNASGRAGALAAREELLRRGHRQVPETGAEAVTVPGALSGWAALLGEYGTISLAQALEPAIRLAEEGFPVSPVIAAQWRAEEDKLSADEGGRTTFLVDGVRAPRAGEWFRNPDLAATFRLIGREGSGALYGGPLGRRVVERLGALGGLLTLDDLIAHRPSWVEPIGVAFDGVRVWELPPNTQGIAALEMLRILEPYDLRALRHNSARYLHHLIEAKKLAFADLERFLGDPQHMEAAATELLSDGFIRERRRHLDPERARERPEPGRVRVASETIYLSAADAAGNMISFINSIYLPFGSGVVVPGTGFALQNRGAGFTLEPGQPNTVAPGKLPLHTLVPAFVTRPVGTGGRGERLSRDPPSSEVSSQTPWADQEPWLSFGVMGGPMQPQGHVQVLLNIIVFDMDVQAAIDAPRFRHLEGRRVALEGPVSDQVRRELQVMGHEIVDETGIGFGGAQAVLRLSRGWAAGSDPRKDGHAAGH